jgi:cytochrome P450
MALNRGIMRNPDMFPDPDEFRPERFLEAKDPRMTSFELPFGVFFPFSHLLHLLMLD